MESNLLSDKFSSFSYRVRNNIYLKTLSVAFAFNFVILISVGIENDMSYILLIALFLIPIFYLNYKMFEKRGQQYLAMFSADQDKITINYYQKDIPMQISILWQDFDFCFGKMKHEEYLVIWDRNCLVLKLFKSFADHKAKFENLYSEIDKYVPANRISESKSFLSTIRSHTKPYSLELME
ncbi:MAG: hypothetical protein EAZ97_13855 [Bacteroidetes bacterium]|nr:MAG: hypothetical protein EAZ97_13855 [Bacteroidota bacterium]